MITPVFQLCQTDTFLVISIKAPYCKVSEAEVYIEENDFKFYAKPYFLRLNLPGAIVEDGRESATYDCETGTFTIKAAKVVPGEVFDGLEMLTKLLAPSKPMLNNSATIEVLSNTDERCVEQFEEELEFDWQIEQIPYTEPDLLTQRPKYGFGNQKSGIFSRLESEYNDLIDLKDADTTPWQLRKSLRQEDENKHFNEDHYMADFIDEDCTIKQILHFKPVWHGEIQKNASVVFTDEEKEKMLKLPRKEYILDKNEQQLALLSLVDILFGYVYNHIVTEGENNVESGWNICKLSSTLSWLDIQSNLEEVLKSCFRRCLCYPLYRHWQLTEKVLKEVCNIFLSGRSRILKSLLEIHTIFNESDARYVLNDVYITDYCVWIQSLGQNSFESLAHHLKQIDIKKCNADFNIETIEQASLLVQDEQISNSLIQEVESLHLSKNNLCDSSSTNFLSGNTAVGIDKEDSETDEEDLETDEDDTETDKEDSETDEEDSETDSDDSDDDISDSNNGKNNQNGIDKNSIEDTFETTSIDLKSDLNTCANKNVIVVNDQALNF